MHKSVWNQKLGSYHVGNAIQLFLILTVLTVSMKRLLYEVHSPHRTQRLLTADTSLPVDL